VIIKQEIKGDSMAEEKEEEKMSSYNENKNSACKSVAIYFQNYLREPTSREKILSAMDWVSLSINQHKKSQPRLHSLACLLEECLRVMTAHRLKKSRLRGKMASIPL